MDGLAAGHSLTPGVVYAMKRPRYEGEGFVPYPYSMMRHNLPEDMFFAVATTEKEFEMQDMPLETPGEARDFRGGAPDYEGQRGAQRPSRRNPIGGQPSLLGNDMPTMPEKIAQPDVPAVSGSSQVPVDPPATQLPPETTNPVQTTQAPAIGGLAGLADGSGTELEV